MGSIKSVAALAAAMISGGLFMTCSTTSTGSGGSTLPYQIFSDKVIQGKYTARVTPSGLESDMSGQVEKWSPKNDLKDLPGFEAPGFPLLERLYSMALDEALMDIREDGAFMAGAKWAGVWTRDISYSIHLALALVMPSSSEKSLREKVNTYKLIIQDTGTGGSWPISTDRIVWGLAAWELYKSNGKKEWLDYAFTVLKNSADRDQAVAYDSSTGLFFGESSFMDWRDQSYPKWMRPVDIFQSRSLSTNVLHKEKFTMLALMAAELGRSDLAQSYEAQGKALAKAIDTRLWLEDKGYHSSYMYPQNTGNILTDKPDILGQNLSVLLNAVPSRDTSLLLEKIPVVPFGVPCFYPQIAGIRPYHNKAIWPFVTAYYSWAGAKAGNQAAADHGMRSIWRAAALFLTNKENMVYNTGHFDGTAINSDRQLWSVAGMLSTVYRTLFGIELNDQGVSFRPWVDKSLGLTGDLKIKNFKVRDMSLDITLIGLGTKIKSLTVDGIEKGGDFVLPFGTKGKHGVVITLADPVYSGKINLLAADAEGAGDPVGLKLEAVGGKINLTWNPVPGAAAYRVWKNGAVVTEVKEPKWAEVQGSGANYTVQAVSSEGYPSNIAAPVSFYPDPVLMFEAEKGRFTADRLANDEGGTGDGYVDLNDEGHDPWEIDVTVAEAGNYLLTFMYSNGSGPISTDNNCALRTLTINGKVQKVKAVFPQTEDWGNFMTANPMVVSLVKGKNTLKLSYDPGSDLNMDTEMNGIYLDSFTLQVLR